MSGYRAFAPATISNLSVGFDILGLALDEPGDEVIVNKGKKNGVVIKSIVGAKGLLTKDPLKNTAGFATIELLKHLGEEGFPVEIDLIKKMGIGTGLGSSAASAVAAVLGVNELLGRPLTRRELLPFALAGERCKDNSCPADNVAPSLLGGIILLNDPKTIEFSKLFAPKGLYITVIYPHIELLTLESRRQLPNSITLEQHISQSAKLASFITGLSNSNLDLIKASLEDVIIEPSRSLHIPKFQKIKELAMLEGALGHGISGSGPSMFALCPNSLIAEKVSNNVSSYYTDQNIESTCFVSKINQLGAKIL